MRMLPDAVPQEESRAMARRLVEPVWKVVVEKGDERTKYEALLSLANADPKGVLEKLESAKFLSKVLGVSDPNRGCRCARGDGRRRCVCGCRVDRRPRRARRGLDRGG